MDAAVITGSVPYLNHAPRLFASTPLTTIRFRDINLDDANALAKSKLLGLIQTLQLYNIYSGYEGCHALVCSEHLSALVKLDLIQALLNADGLRDLLQTPHGRQLRHLGLFQNYLGEDGNNFLGQCSPIESLRSLNLRYALSESNRAVALSTSAKVFPVIGPIFLLKTPEITRKLMRRYLGTELLRHLEYLQIGDNELSAENLFTLADTLTPGKLKTFDVRVNPIGDQGSELLASHPAFSDLQYLNVSACSLTDRGAKAIATSANLSQLVDLDVKCNYLTNDGAIGFFEQEQLTRLHSINLGFNEISTEVVERLQKIQGVDNLVDEQLVLPRQNEIRFDRLYTFSGESNYCFSGKLPDGRLAVFDEFPLDSDSSDVNLYYFDRQGRFTHTEVLDFSQLKEKSSENSGLRSPEKKLKAAFQLIGFNPTEIDIRGFVPNDEPCLMPVTFEMNDFVLGKDDWMDDEEREYYPRHIRAWIARGHYVFQWGDDRWCDEHGRVNST